MANATVDIIIQTSRDLLGKNLYILHFAIFNGCLTLLCCVYLVSELYTLWSRVGLRGSHRHMDGKKCFRCGRTVVRYKLKNDFVVLCTHFCTLRALLYYFPESMS